LRRCRYAEQGLGANVDLSGCTNPRLEALSRE
jgi:hypothetical protein